ARRVPCMRGPAGSGPPVQVLMGRESMPPHVPRRTDRPIVYNDGRACPWEARSPLMPRSSADLPLHTGSAPPWLFRRMTEMAGAIGTLIVRDGGPQELLRRLSDPFWFQAFGCVLGFDWHSSGVTTTVCGAVKEGIKEIDLSLGFFAAGGKGAASRRTPMQIADACDALGRDPRALVHASRTAAKVDSA